MSSCQGELPETKFDVKAVDQNGNVLVNKTTATLKNGFFELWLPRNRSIKLIIQGSGRQAEGSIGTFDNSKTCVTTLRLR
ncbi:MAG: CueP family metal-binding protein [Desulfobacterales bacterium]|jgi:hypothetical protein